MVLVVIVAAAATTFAASVAAAAAAEFYSTKPTKMRNRTERQLDLFSVQCSVRHWNLVRQQKVNPIGTGEAAAVSDT